MNILSIIVFLPTFGALLCLFAPKRHVRTVAVLATLATFIVALLLFGTFLGGADGSSESVFGSSYGKLHHVERADWITGHNFAIEYFMGVDGLGFPLVILTTLIGFLACLASWNFDSWKMNKGVRAYFVLYLMLETGMLGVFMSLDFFLFYIFWEVMLLPMYFLIGVWGGARKEYAAIKFFLFTLAGSVLMLVALVAMFFYSDAAVQAAGARLSTSLVDLAGQRGDAGGGEHGKQHGLANPGAGENAHALALAAGDEGVEGFHPQIYGLTDPFALMRGRRAGA